MTVRPSAGWLRAAGQHFTEIRFSHDLLEDLLVLAENLLPMRHKEQGLAPPDHVPGVFNIVG